MSTKEENKESKEPEYDEDKEQLQEKQEVATGEIKQEQLTKSFEPENSFSLLVGREILFKAFISNSTHANFRSNRFLLLSSYKTTSQ
jgi:hypothetical protein